MNMKFNVFLFNVYKRFLFLSRFLVFYVFYFNLDVFTSMARILRVSYIEMILKHIWKTFPRLSSRESDRFRRNLADGWHHGRSGKTNPTLWNFRVIVPVIPTSGMVKGSENPHHASLRSLPV